MTPFKAVTNAFWTSPQITPEDVASASELGIVAIINNRPEGEAPDQTPGADIARAADQAGIAYCEIPVTPGGFTQDQVVAMSRALDNPQGPVLAYCRSGTRSILLWALSQAAGGRDPGEVAADAAQAGYDVAPVSDALTQLF